MYRCVALAALEAGISLDDGEALGELARALEIGLDGRRALIGERDVSAAIREPGVTAAASRVSVHPQVREAMVGRQRQLIAAGSYVAEGRDIGTVVSPDSPLKVFLTASDAERARRRAAQTGEDFESVLDAQRRRDARDTEREHGALRAADDAVELDTTMVWKKSWTVVVIARERRDMSAASSARIAGERPRAGPRMSTRLPTVAVVGFPNVGKSTLVNRLVGGSEAVTAAEPGVTRDRKRLSCEWNGVAFDLIDTGGIDLEDEAELARDVQSQARLAIAEADAVLMVVDGRAGLRAGDAELARTLRGGDVPVLVAVNKADKPNDFSDHRRVPRPRAGRAAGGLRQPRARHRRPARRARPRPRRPAAAAGGRRRRPHRRDRPPQRRQVLAGQRLPRLRPGDRLRHRRHHPRRDRHRARGRRPPHDPGRHRRPAPPLQGRRPDRLLRAAALRAGGRARRRRDRRLRRLRGRHLRGPAGGRDGDESRLRDPAGAEQVGPDRRPTSTTPGPGSRASCGCGRRSSPARRPAGATSRRCCRKRCGWPTAPASGSRPRT